MPGRTGRDREAIALREQAATGAILSPRIVVSGMVNSRAVKHYRAASPGALAKMFVQLGVDGLKIRDGLSSEDLIAVLEVGRSSGLPVYGHSYDVTRTLAEDANYTEWLVVRGLAGVMHVLGLAPIGKGEARPAPDDWQQSWLVRATRWLSFPEREQARLINTLVEHDVWLEPTLLTEEWVGNAESYRRQWAVRGLPGSFAELHDGWPVYTDTDLATFRRAQRAMQRFVRAFHLRGGRILAGTDTLPVSGYGLQDELESLVRAGLSPAAALRAATVDAAAASGRDGEVGCVCPGAHADLVLLDANPLAHISAARRIRLVLLGGRPVPTS